MWGVRFGAIRRMVIALVPALEVRELARFPDHGTSVDSEGGARPFNPKLQLLCARMSVQVTTVHELKTECRGGRRATPFEISGWGTEHYFNGARTKLHPKAL